MNRSQIAKSCQSRALRNEFELTAVNRIYASKCREQSKVAFTSVDSVQAEGDIVHYSHGIFPAIDKMWEDVPGVGVTSNAL